MTVGVKGLLIPATEEQICVNYSLISFGFNTLANHEQYCMYKL